MTFFGGIEAGGTKFVCAIGTGPEHIESIVKFPTTNPTQTLDQAVDFFKKSSTPLSAIGIASFGPIDLHPSSPTYGRITTTPKPGWQNTDIVGRLESASGLPVAFDTDVNGAALAEHRWGAAQSDDTFVYLTIGTGIGGGGMVGGKLIHGALHPEMGHMPLPRDPERDPFSGICPYHGDCFEGLAAGPAIEARWGVRGEQLGADHPAWQLEAHYLALGLMNIITILSPTKIILGGGVMQQPNLFELLRHEVQSLLNGYIQAPQLFSGIDEYIVPPALGNQTGVLGAIALAQMFL